MDKERREKTVRAQDAEADGVIEGRNAVIEALRAGASIDKIFIQKGETDRTLGHIASTARAALNSLSRKSVGALPSAHEISFMLAPSSKRNSVFPVNSNQNSLPAPSPFCMVPESSMSDA